MLRLYRQALALRRSLPAFADSTFRWLAAPTGCLAFARGSRDPVTCALNMGEREQELPVGRDVLLATTSDVRLEGGRLLLPPSTAAWVGGDRAGLERSEPRRAGRRGG